MKRETEEEAQNSERLAVLNDLEDWLETPMLVLGFAWLALLLVELIWGLTPMLEAAGTVIWGVFVLDFALRLTLAPAKRTYLRHNWLTAVSLLLPALRVFRVARMFRMLRAARATRGLRLVKVVGSINRGMRSLGRSMARRGFGYVVALTSLITVAGAAGMHAFEREVPDGLHSYGEALWWTAMLMTTMGSEYWPRTAEGRVLSLLLAVYAFAVFGYVTAAIASFFVGRDAADPGAEVAGASSVDALRVEIATLREELRHSRVGRPL